MRAPRDNEIKFHEKEAQDLINQTLNLPWGGISTQASPDIGEWIYIQIGLPDRMYRFRNSEYYPSETRIVHFTPSVDIACLILSSCTFRLYNLYRKNDKYEYTYANKVLEQFTQPTDKYNFNLTTFENIVKDETFIFSGTRTKNIKDFWGEKYSNYGNGVGFELTFKNDPLDWEGFYLGKVKYGVLDKFIKLKSGFDQLSEKNKNVDYKVLLNQILPFHKDSTWSQEDEIRIMTYEPEKYGLQIFKDTGDPRWRCINLPIYSKVFENIDFSRYVIPYFRIEKIHIGPKCEKGKVDSIKKIIREKYLNNIPVVSYFT